MAAPEMQSINPEDPLAREGWTHLIPVGRCTLPRGSGAQEIAILWQEWPDSYEAGSFEPGYGALPEAGRRACVTAKACYWQLRPSDAALKAAFGAVYEVLNDAAPDGFQRHDIATLYAGYYPATRVLCIGEVALHSSVLRGNFEAGTLLARLWDAFERALLEAFPQAQTICTRGGSQDYHTPFYRALLAARGYAPGDHYSYRKTALAMKTPAPDCG